MAQVFEGKTVWDDTLGNLGFSQDHSHIISTLKLLFQNISDQIYSLQNFEASSSQDEYDMRNLTFPIFSDNFTMTGPNLEMATDTILLLRTGLQYLVTFISLLIGAWVFNRFTFRSNFIKIVAETVISLLIFVPVLPPIVAFFTILLSIRLGIWAYLKKRYGSSKFLLAPVDAFWAYESYGSCSACVGLYVIEGTCDPDKVRQRIIKTVESDLVDEKMSRKLTSVLGFPCWEVVDEMDMDNHVKVVLDSGTPSTESDVFEFMRSFQDQPMVGKAPWEVYVVPNLRHPSSSTKTGSQSHYAVIFRIHHAIMDGISTGNILHSVMADEPFEFSVDPIDPFHGKNPSKFQTFLTFFVGLLSVPRVLLLNIILVDNQHNKFFQPGPTLTGPKTFTWSRPIKMEGLKHLKNSTKTSVFNVLASSLGGAYRQSCLRNGKAPSADFFHLISPVALLPYPDRKPRNRFSGVLVPVYVGKGQSPLKRLEINYKNIKELGSSVGSSLVLGNYYFPMILGVMPLFLHRILGSFMHVKMSLSNVPGPKEQVMIYDGGKIVDIGIWVPIKLSVGLGMGLFSYGDRVRATVIGDKAYFPQESDVQFIADAFEKELTDLAEAVGLPEHLLFNQC